uniref:Uncharacterized protein n=1 Tax=Magallana gigas TaxID=29159 RepID=A0A8W8IUG3_MAGGI
MGVMETLCFAAILLLFTTPQTESLSIKRQVASSDADLTAALAVLQRHRRQASDIDYLRSYLLENRNKIPPSYLNALNENYGLNLESYYSKQPNAEDILDRQMLMDAYKPKNYKDVGLFDLYEPDKRNVKRSRTAPSKAELAEIFGDINKASERTHKRQISTQLPGSDFSSQDDSLNSEKQKVSKSAMKKMFEENSDRDNGKDTNQKEENDKKHTQVSNSELKNVFGDEVGDKEEQAKPTSTQEQAPEPAGKESKEERSTPTEGERFEALARYENLANIKSEKKKRVEKRDYDSEIELSQSVLDLTKTVAALRDEVARLKIAEALEDKENDLLASALKQATLGQLQGTEGNLKKEFLDIQNAIRVEEQLQSIKTPEEEENDESSDEDSVEEEFPVANKRQTISEDLTQNENANIGQWYENPVDDEESNEQQKEGVTVRFLISEADDTIRAFAAKALAYKQQIKEKENENAMEELMSSLGPSERQQLAEGFLGNSAYDEPSNENNCPGVNYLTSQCSVAKMAGLRIDDEAKNLCNRHEICYTCGGSLSFTQSTCDAGFRGDVIEMCGKDTECIENGAKFLWFLKSEHTYNYVYLDKCDSGCVSDFIKGL